MQPVKESKERRSKNFIVRLRETSHPFLPSFLLHIPHAFNLRNDLSQIVEALAKSGQSLVSARSVLLLIVKFENGEAVKTQRICKLACEGREVSNKLVPEDSSFPLWENTTNSERFVRFSTIEGKERKKVGISRSSDFAGEGVSRLVQLLRVLDRNRGVPIVWRGRVSDGANLREEVRDICGCLFCPFGKCGPYHTTKRMK